MAKCILHSVCGLREVGGENGTVKDWANVIFGYRDIKGCMDRRRYITWLEREK